jgi:hypothetical protein
MSTGKGNQDKAPSQKPFPRKQSWAKPSWVKPDQFVGLPYGIFTTGLLVFLIILKGLSIYIANATLYSIPIVGGTVQSVELAELVNIILFSILGMGLGIGVVWAPAARPVRFSRYVLMVCIPLLFFSGAFFRYNLWVGAVQQQMGISAREARTITNQWLETTVHHGGVFGFYHYTAQYSVLPTTPQFFQASVQGGRRVDEMLSKVLRIPPSFTDFLLTLCMWLLRLFYFGLSGLAALYHFQEGLGNTQFQQKLQTPRSPRKAYKKLK